MIQDMSLLETLAPREKSPAIAGMRVVPVAGLEVQPEAAVPGDLTSEERGVERCR